MRAGSLSRLLGACAALVVAGASQAQQPASPVGLWATEGYGLVLDVRADSVATFEVTKVSCIPAMHAPVTVPPSGALTAFRMPDTPVTFVVTPGSTPTEARVRIAYTA